MGDFLVQVQAALADRYTIERELGRGGMATVYLAQDLKHHRPVALKVLNPQIAAVLGSERFLREIETAANLNHPHILPLFDSGAAGQPGSGPQFLWYTMPLVKGESLRDLMNREPQLSMDRTLGIARDVAGALAHAHAAGIVHRDIKPENILLTGDYALVADFGIARAIGAAGGERLTETGLAIGTAAYMSPEQASGERNLDGRSDIYALGCVMYEMLAGQPPFTGPTAQSVLARHAVDPVPSLHTVRQDITDGVEQAIARALAKVPAARFATATEFSDALVGPYSGRPVSGPSGMPSVRPHRARWVVATLAASATILVGWTLLRPGTGNVDAPSTVVAVLPLTPSGADTGLIRLGRDLVVTLSANLDGVGDIRTVDANTILTRAEERSTALPLADAAAFAQRLGAGRVIQGSLVRTGSDVRVDLALFDSKDLHSLARSTVTAAPEHLVAITDSLTAALLAQIWRKGTPPSPSLAALTTPSIPALRSFLNGERLLVEGYLDSAAGAYQEAIRADSTFWLAYFRYAYVFNWTERSGADSLADIAWEHRAELPERERLLLEIPRESTRSIILRRSKDYVDRYPDYWPGWFQFADYLTHGPGSGFTIDDAINALERTVDLNPNVAWAWEHLFSMTLTYDTPKAARALAQMTRLEAGGQSRSRPFYLPGYRMLLRTAQQHSLDTVLMDSVARSVASRGDAMAWPTDLTTVFLHYGFGAAQTEFSRRVLRFDPDRDHTIEFGFSRAYTWANRGGWDSIQGEFDRLITQSAGNAEPVVNAYRMEVFGVWLGGLPPSVAVKRGADVAQAVSRYPGTLTSYDDVFRRWWDGLLADATRDKAALKLARETLRGDTTNLARLPERSLAAFELGLSGNYRGAADSMTAVVRATVDALYCCGTFQHVNRLAASRWLLAVGDTVAAGEILGPIDLTLPLFFGGPMYLARARINEALGRKREARRDYNEFLRRYDQPVARQRHLVDEARGAVRRLSGLGGDPVQQ